MKINKSGGNVLKKLMIISICILSFTAGTLMQVKNSKFNNPDFTEGFEAGVRFGCLVLIKNPTQDNIPVLIKEAKETYLFLKTLRRRLLDED